MTTTSVTVPTTFEKYCVEYSFVNLFSNLSILSDSSYNKHHSKDFQIEFNHYLISKPEPYEDAVQEIISVSSSDILDTRRTVLDYFSYTFQKLENHEWGLSSKLCRFDEADNYVVYHIPMIDFKNKGDPAAYLAIMADIESLMGRKLGLFYLFDSGNSYHGYFTECLEPPEWQRFMHCLFSLSYRFEEPFGKSEDQLLDQRWVSHCLKQGKSVLRWTGHTKTPLLLVDVLNAV